MGLIRAVLAVQLAITALPVGDAVGGSVAQELTTTTMARGGRGQGG